MSRCPPQPSQGRSSDHVSTMSARLAFRRVRRQGRLDTHAAVGCADTGGRLERAAIDRDADVDLARGGAVLEVPLDRLIGRDVRAHAAVQVRLVVGLECKRGRESAPYAYGSLPCRDGEICSARTKVSQEPA